MTKIIASLAFVLISAGFFVNPASATIVQRLAIESVPPGAEVYLTRATKKIAIGKTPFVYSAEFHSEISIIRMLFRKRGYKDVTLKVSAEKDKVLARLESLSIAAEPDVHKDPQLSNIQKQLNPIINRSVPKLLEQATQLDINLAAPTKVAGTGEEAFLIVPIVIRSLQNDIKGTSEARQTKVLRVLWKHLGGTIVVPLAREIRDHDGIKGILLEARLDEKQYIFNVKPELGTKTEMECVGGYKTVQIYAPHRPKGYITTKVYVLCLYKRPVTKFGPKVNAKLRVAKDQAVARYFLPFNVLDSKIHPEELYEKIGILLTDSKGKQLKSQGTVPIPASR